MCWKVWQRSLLEQSVFESNSFVVLSFYFSFYSANYYSLIFILSNGFNVSESFFYRKHFLMLNGSKKKRQVNDMIRMLNLLKRLSFDCTCQCGFRLKIWNFWSAVLTFYFVHYNLFSLSKEILQINFSSLVCYPDNFCGTVIARGMWQLVEEHSSKKYWIKNVKLLIFFADRKLDFQSVKLSTQSLSNNKLWY